MSVWNSFKERETRQLSCHKNNWWELTLGESYEVFLLIKDGPDIPWYISDKPKSHWSSLWPNGHKFHLTLAGRLNGNRSGVIVLIFQKDNHWESNGTGLQSWPGAWSKWVWACFRSEGVTQVGIFLQIKPKFVRKRVET